MLIPLKISIKMVITFFSSRFRPIDQLTEIEEQSENCKEREGWCDEWVLKIHSVINLNLNWWSREINDQSTMLKIGSMVVNSFKWDLANEIIKKTIKKSLTHVSFTIQFPDTSLYQFPINHCHLIHSSRF